MLNEEGARLRKQIEQLIKAKADAEKRCATTSAGGFQRVMNLTAALAPWVKWVFFNGKYYGKDRKIWLGNEMVYDPALHWEAEEDEEGSPEDERAEEEKTEDHATDGGNPKENAEGGNA